MNHGVQYGDANHKGVPLTSTLPIPTDGGLAAVYSEVASGRSTES